MLLPNACLTIVVALLPSLAQQPAASAIQEQSGQPQQSADGQLQSLTRVRLSGRYMAARRIAYVAPVFPLSGRLQGVSEASVVLVVDIGPDGTVERTMPMSGPTEFRKPAAEAVKQWTYQPYSMNGRPAAVETTVTVEFKR